MAVLFQRLLLFWGLLVALLFTQGQARSLDHSLVESASLEHFVNLNTRVPTSKNQLPWPCLPDKRRPKASAKDPGASVGVLPFTESMILSANEQHGPFKPGDKPSNSSTSVLPLPLPSSSPSPSPAPRLSPSLWELEAGPGKKRWESAHLTKRTNGQVTSLYNRAAVRVPTEGSNLIYWQQYRNNIESGIIATNDLSGCTVVAVTSPHVVMMVHVWERRDEATWLLDPYGQAQVAKDNEFVTVGENLVQSLLNNLGGNLANGFNAWLPRGQTAVNIVAPAMNPDRQDLTMPWYTLVNQQGLIYENGANNLQRSISRMVGDPTGGEMHTYRRRYSNDPLHGTDDRDKIALVPFIFNGHTYVNMMYDDDKLKPIQQIN